MSETPHLNDYLADSPKNWGKWGPEDEVGSLNYLANPEVLAGVAEIKSGKTFTLGADVPVLSKAGSVKLALARTKQSGNGADLTRTTTSVGYDHFLSKRTDLYAVGMYDKVTDLSSGTSVLVGIRHRF